MSRVILILLAAIGVLRAQSTEHEQYDPWEKVRNLKTGTELRIFKRGVTQPVIAESGDLTEKNLIVVVKNSQIAIAREQIDRIEARPTGRSRIRTESKTETLHPGDGEPPRAFGRSGPLTSTSSGVTFGGKPPFETIYRRTPPANQDTPVTPLQ